MSRNELQAEIDALRAEHAMITRRLEMRAEEVRKKSAEDMVAINMAREEITRLKDQVAARDQSLADLETQRQEVVGQLFEREAALETASSKLADTRRLLAERTDEVQQLSRNFEEASITASSRQVELVSREGEIERLNDILRSLRAQHKEAETALRESIKEKREAEEALRVQRRRNAELERKFERMMSERANFEQKLDRREREIARLRQMKKGDSASPAEERGAAVLPVDVPILLSDAGVEVQEPAQPQSEVERLRSRLSALMRENKRLRGEMADIESTEEPGDEVLRERISSLAAEVVNMTAALEGPDSPIEKVLSNISGSHEASQTHGPSLADRVIALRQASGRAEQA